MSFCSGVCELQSSSELLKWPQITQKWICFLTQHWKWCQFMWTVGLWDLDFCVNFPMLYLYSVKRNRNSCGLIYLIYWNISDGLLKYSFSWPVTAKRASVQHDYIVFRWEESHLSCLSLASHFLHMKNTSLYWSWVSECSRQNSLMHWGLDSTEEFHRCERVKMTLWGWYYELIKQKPKSK